MALLPDLLPDRQTQPIVGRTKGEEVRLRCFPPKTKAGGRTISIPALLVADLKRWKLQCPLSRLLGIRQLKMEAADLDEARHFCFSGAPSTKGRG